MPDSASNRAAGTLPCPVCGSRIADYLDRREGGAVTLSCANDACGHVYADDPLERLYQAPSSRRARP